MVTDQARGLALRLLASYPGWPVSEMSVLAIAESLDRIDEAEAVVDRARTEFSKPPSVAQLYEVATEIRRQADVPDRYALSPGVVMAEMPPDVREKIAALHDKLALPERDYEEEDREWQRRKAAVLSRGRLHGVCVGAGRLAERREGLMVCPDCGIEVT